MASTTIECSCPRDPCDHLFELEAEIEPADSAYGADADGHRGIHVPAYLQTPDTPTKCPKCYAEYTVEELEEIANEIQEQVDDWEPPYPDYDPD